MEKISMREFLVTQPNFPEESETDIYYLGVANHLLAALEKSPEAAKLPDGVRRKIALTLACYFQDVVADAGIWRCFIDTCRRMYGRALPFFTTDEDYVDYELNSLDVRFLVWYALAMFSDSHRYIYPLAPEIKAIADRCHTLLDKIYLEAPESENFLPLSDLDMHDPEDQKDILKFGQWIFYHCYLMTPSFSYSLLEMMQSDEARNADDKTAFLNSVMEDAIIENPIGPLALFVNEWLPLFTEGRLIDITESGKSKIHPYYEAFTRATGGEVISFFGTYEEMNAFFIEKMGWEAGQEHLAMSKGASDYILLVNPRKGMLMARGVARCIAAPGNPFYDKDYARSHAFEMLAVRGICPGDLVKFAGEKGWIPDAAFPGTDDTDLATANYDFIARCFLQLYYRE